MDPSAAPWRVLEASGPPATGDPTAPAVAPPRRAGPVSVATVAAVVGSIVLAVAAFLVASASTGTGVVTIEGGGTSLPFGSTGENASHIGPSSDTAIGAIGAGGAGGAGEVVVEVAGAVLRPGVFHLPGGSRVGDLIAAAGGYGPRLDAARATRELNLAARLGDGDRVIVPSRDDAVSSTTPAGTAGSTASRPAGAPIDLNRATVAELDALPGIGPVTAAKIVASREQQAFTAVDDLRARKLVGPATFGKLKDLVSVH